MTKRSYSICDRENSNEVKPVDVSTFKKARIGATNLFDPQRIVGKQGHADVSTKPEHGNVGLSAVENSGMSSLDCWSCSSDERDDEGNIDDIFSKESVRKKLQFLGYMVGMTCGNPAEILSEVVRVLKELNGGMWCNSHAKLK